MAAPALPDLAALGVTPISEGAPTGADASYEPEYEAMQHEIDKLSIASESGEATDWTLTASLAASILAGKSKDLKAAAYLAEALARTDGLPGLARGVHILRDMVETFWDGLFPPKKRMRGRLNAIDWWQDRARTFLEGYGGPPLPQETAKGLTDDLDALDRVLADKSDEAPPLHPLIEAAKRLPVEAPADPEPAPSQEAAPLAGEKAEADPASTAAPAASAASAAQAASGAPGGSADPGGSAGSGDQAREQLKSGLDLLFSASYALFKEDARNPVPYRLVRLAAWLPLVAPPPAKSGKTMIPPPPPPVRGALEQALSSGNVQAALEGAESHVNEFRFWLDLSRISAEALKNLGPDHLAAREALEAETALFARRFPGVENLAFSDGTPFADDRTRLWLSRLGGSGGGKSAASPDCAGGEDVESVMDQARELEDKNQAVDAVLLLQDRIGSAKSGRMRLRWRIGLAEILMASGSPESARPIAGQILADLDAHKLDDFDPELALAGLLAARKALAACADEAAKAGAAEILARIMRLNPAVGLRISGLQ